MPNKIISKVETIHVNLQSSARILENGAERARDQAISYFGIDECGYADKVNGWERSSCSIEIEFVGLKMSGGMGGWSYNLTFKAWCEKYEEDEG